MELDHSRIESLITLEEVIKHANDKGIGTNFGDFAAIEYVAFLQEIQTHLPSGINELLQYTQEMKEVYTKLCETQVSIAEEEYMEQLKDIEKKLRNGDGVQLHLFF